MFEFTNDTPTCVDRIEMDTKVFDGEKVVSLKDEKFSIRKQALWNGILVVSIVLDNNGNLISVPILTELGISKTEKMKNALLEISLKIEDYIEGLNETETSDDEDLKEILKKIINAERVGFEPTLRYKRKHAFQACAFSHSAISPKLK